MHLKKINMTTEESILVYKALRILIDIQKDALNKGLLSEMPIRAKVDKDILIIPQEDSVLEDFTFALDCVVHQVQEKKSLRAKINDAPLYSQSIQFILDDIFSEED